MTEVCRFKSGGLNLAPVTCIGSDRSGGLERIRQRGGNQQISRGFTHGVNLIMAALNERGNRDYQTGHAGDKPLPNRDMTGAARFRSGGPKDTGFKRR